MIAVMAIISLSFTSCDRDSEVAGILDGTWSGQMSIKYGGYTTTRSVIHFDNDNDFYSGTGYWLDYYDGSYWNNSDVRPSRFTWKVNQGVIYIYFTGEDSNLRIYNYTISDNYFSGVIKASNGNEAKFNLTKDTGYYNWRGYNYYNKVSNSTDSLNIVSSTDSLKPKREVVSK